MGHFSMKKLFELSALVSPRVASGLGLVLLTSVLGGTGCGLSYSLTGLYVEPTTADGTCLYPGSSAQYHAYGTYTEGGHALVTKDLSSTVSWSATVPDLAAVSTAGLVTADSTDPLYVGTTGIEATTQGEFGNLTAGSSLQVSTSCSTSSSLAKPFSLHVIPGNQALPVGDTERPLAIAFGSGGSANDLSGKLTWESSDANVAKVDRTGLITAVGPGDATITATGKAPNGETISATQTVHFTANN